MRKLFFLFLTLVATTSLWAEDFSVGGIYYNYLDGNNVEVTYRGNDYNSYYNEYSGAVIIPSTVRYNGTTYSVTNIGDEAFRGCSSLTSITIPNSVTSIGKWAFQSCSSLTSVTINSDAIVNKTYSYSSNISDIFGSQVIEYIIGDDVKGIGYAAFDGCFSLTSITIGNSVTSIGDGAFRYCESLNTITCLAMTPPALLGEHVFYGCYYPTLFVPCAALSDYQLHEQWGQFTTIECISSEETDTEDVIIESGTTTIQKIMRDGQLIILRDGVEYNAMGAEIQ